MKKAPLAFVAALALASTASRFALADEPKGVIASTEKGMNLDELDRLVKPLTEDGDKAAAVKQVSELGQDAVPAIAAKLTELRKASPGPIVTAVKSVRVTENGDLAKALIDAGKTDKNALVTAVLIRALVRIGTTPAARQLVKIAGDANGAFRPEVSRQVKALGDKAIPAVIEARKDPSFDVRRWAFGQLESMGKRLAGDAVQTKDNEVLADVLRAYGSIHDLDSVPVVLSFVNSDRVQIRTAAREAVAQFGQDAVWKLREAYATLTGKPAPEAWSAAECAKELFAAFDKVRLQEVYSLLEEGLKSEKDGQLDDAITKFDKVLARQPMLDRRVEMVPAFVARARRLEDRHDPAAAAATLEKALRLSPDGPRASSIRSELAYLEGKSLLERGIQDVEPFKRALTLDATNIGARNELNQMETVGEERQSRVTAVGGAIAILLAAVVGIILFTGGRRPKKLNA